MKLRPGRLGGHRRTPAVSRPPAPHPLVLLAAGAVLYLARAAVYATSRPNPWPWTIGFYEVLHGLVIAAATIHFVAMAGRIVPEVPTS